MLESIVTPNGYLVLSQEKNKVAMSKYEDFRKHFEGLETYEEMIQKDTDENLGFGEFLRRCKSEGILE